MKHTFTLFILFYVGIVCSQTITGKLLDENNNPIAFASIQIKNTGVISNVEGEFSLEIDKFEDDDIVNISFLGFEKLEIPIKNFTSKNYILIEEINKLTEIFISNKKLNLDEVLLKMNENLESNYSINNTTQLIFNRNSYYNKFKKFEFEITKSTLLTKKDLKELNKSIDYNINKNLNKTSKFYTESLSYMYFLKDNTKIKVLKATQLINKKEDISQEAIQKLFFNAIAGKLEKDATYKVKSGLIPVTDSLKFNMDTDKEMYKDSSNSKSKKKYYSSLINKYLFKGNSPLTFATNVKKYNYSLREISNYEDGFVYIIDFTPKASSAKFSGTMYINGYDFAIVKLDFEYANNRTGKGLNLKFLLGIKYKNNLWKTSVIYKKNLLGNYNLKFLKQAQGSYVYMSRPFKIKKNKANKLESKKLIKIDVLMELSTKDVIELFFIEENEISKSDINSFKEKEKYKIDYISKYTPEIWKGYNVLAPIQEIKNYDTGVE